MPRFTLTNAESRLLGAALLDYALANGLNGAEALVAAAATTAAELHAVATQYLNAEKAKLQAQLATVSTRATAETNQLNSDIAAVDSALLKV